MVPRKCPLEFYKLYFLTVQFSDDLGPPMFCKGTELFREVHFFHGAPHLSASSLLRKPDYGGKAWRPAAGFRFAIAARSSMIAAHGGNFQSLRTGVRRGEMVRSLAGRRFFPSQPRFTETGLYHRHASAERHRRAHPWARPE